MEGGEGAGSWVEGGGGTWRSPVEVRATSAGRDSRYETEERRRKDKEEEKRKKEQGKNLMDVGPICQWLILLLMSLNQTENGLVPSFLNQTENKLVPSHKLET